MAYDLTRKRESYAVLFHLKEIHIGNMYDKTTELDTGVEESYEYGKCIKNSKNTGNHTVETAENGYPDQIAEWTVTGFYSDRWEFLYGGRVEKDHSENG